MTRPKAGRDSFADIIPLMDSALHYLERGLDEFTLDCGTRGRAINTTQRMNAWRAHDRGRDPSGDLYSKYNMLTFRVRDTSVVARMRDRIPIIAAWAVDAEGNRIPIPLEEIQEAARPLSIPEAVAQAQLTGDNPAPEDWTPEMKRAGEEKLRLHVIATYEADGTVIKGFEHYIEQHLAARRPESPEEYERRKSAEANGAMTGLETTDGSRRVDERST